LRALVRQAIARHAGPSTLVPSHPAPSHSHLAPPHLAPSHWVFAVPSGADAEGPCIIEPTVMCNHCGYCQSMGH
jgi:hypothetical protein